VASCRARNANVNIHDGYFSVVDECIYKLHYNKVTNICSRVSKDLGLSRYKLL
jgi:hypothetical protein